MSNFDLFIIIIAVWLSGIILGSLIQLATTIKSLRKREIKGMQELLEALDKTYNGSPWLEIINSRISQYKREK